LAELSLAPHSAEYFSKQGLRDFEALWNLPDSLVDEPNRRGRGWSKVSRHELESANGQRRVFYLKRQLNYFPRSRLLGRRLLLNREHRALVRLGKHGIGTLEVAAFGLKKTDGASRGLLVTRSLDGYVDLETAFSQGNWAYLNRLRDPVAGLISRLHAHGFMHGALYPKHVFVTGSEFPGPPDARLIDLEDLWRLPLGNLHRVRDLAKLNRHTPMLDEFAKLRFFYAYLGLRKMTPAGKRLLTRIIKKSQKKASRGPR